MKISNSLYDTLKWICLTFIPGLATFLGVLLPIIGTTAEMTTNIITVLCAAGTFLGVLIGISNAQYTADQIILESEEHDK